jgi:hypothetical protein
VDAVQGPSLEDAVRGPSLEDTWKREALRLHRRYLVEIVEAFELCPWADRATQDGRVRETVLLQTDEELMGPSLGAIDMWKNDPTADVAFAIYPRLRLDRLAFHAFASRLREADGGRHELGSVPFVFAAFHPEASPDMNDAERLIPFLRRTPDPTLQFLRATALDAIRSGASQGTQFVDVAKLDLSHVAPGQTPLRERIARANLATTRRVGVEVLQARLDDIRRDRDDTYSTLAAQA